MSIFGDIKALGAALVTLIVTAAVCSLLNAFWLLPKARNEGRATYIAEQAAADQKAKLERNGDDAKLQRMSDYDLCIAGIGRVPECDALKLRPFSEK